MRFAYLAPPKSTGADRPAESSATIASPPSREQDMPKVGSFTFVLHSHLPYTRQAGRWPHGEEWLHEAAAETYVPLLDALNRLKDEGLSARLTLSLTPILLEQLADPDVRSNFRTYLEQKISAATDDIPRFESAHDPHMTYLARYYRDWYASIQDHFLNIYPCNLLPP